VETCTQLLRLDVLRQKAMPFFVNFVQYGTPQRADKLGLSAQFRS
jgi:hypothetical protein